MLLEGLTREPGESFSQTTQEDQFKVHGSQQSPTDLNTIDDSICRLNSNLIDHCRDNIAEMANRTKKAHDS